MKKIKGEKNIEKVINSITGLIDMSDLDLYRTVFNSKQSILELFFDNYFEKIEGHPFSHDKSVYVVRKINSYIMTGENDVLQETYREHQQNGGDIGGITELDKICYWCPKTIKNSEEAISIIFHYLCIDVNFFKDEYKSILGMINNGY